MTLLPEALAAPVSEPDPSAYVTIPPDSLICPAVAIFDRDAVRSEIAEALSDIEDPREGAGGRNAVTQVLARARRRGRTAIQTVFEAAPKESAALVASYSWLTDALVQEAFRVSSEMIHPRQSPTKGESLSVLAAGGYGRAEMAPHSDVDLLFLTPWKITGWAESVIETMLYILWDLKLQVGHAARTVKECIRLGKEDFTIRTSMLELRPVAGDEALSVELFERLWEELFSTTAKEFIAAKLEERSARHKRQGGQRYMLEPNVKEGKGGLRDLQSLYWIAKYVHCVIRIRELVALGVFTEAEYGAFREAETFFWAVRAHLHLITGREMDQLTFDLQVEVAARMGYSDSAGRRAVERFMQDYFRHATRVGELTRIFLTALEAIHLKPEGTIAGFLKRRRRRKLPERLDVKQGRLTFSEPETLPDHPLDLLRIFDQSLRSGLLLHPEAMRIIAANLTLIDAAVRSRKEASRIFLDLLLKHRNPEPALRRMNELGLLAAFIPEFDPIVAMMQFNVYHSYTVDEHTIQCIGQLAAIERGELEEDLPLATGILRNGGVNRKVLYVAMLLHDIGKGRPEDHSVVGARIARTVCPRLHLKPEEAETVEWLVRYHLVMSDLAQKRDISDPRTVRDFAKAVKSKKRLDLLTVLTVCDIRGVGPNVWNNWKAMLLRSLYRQTDEALENGLEALNRENRGAEAKRALRAALSDWPAADVRSELARHYPPYWQGLPTSAHATLAGMLRGLPADDIRIDLTPDADRDATRACFALADHPGIFSRLAGALALVGANVVDARTYTSKDGWATAIFWVQDADGAPFEEDRLPRLNEMILRTLKGEVSAREALVSRDKVKKRNSEFRFPTSITFDNDGSEIYTIIEVDTRDRPGLLYDLTRTLAEANIYIASAVIATYGAQVVDTFYVKDLFGLKFYTRSKQAALERRLREAVADGARRAGQG
ncbi:[protein-PII] uridylyltransferase [Roseicyclus sp. F158]|uniref:Bifunctional uridylyltransferase/uridylyl-removing enzyme n=1 Tax=Tropicimonas omnivorans TaxID=3075590 RepID=A0ABU3DFE8_9RHOB|nr:[protein-PII] uridylyltransferase [Roseicyclus sp. F158]MDT0682447.1 [protein-PII] uridylyltransferase [Roseicyclus sp. F158]